MKKIIGLLFIIISFSSCGDEKDCCVNFEPVNVTLKFTQNWDGVPITTADFNDFKFATKNGEYTSINRLRYVVSNISVGNAIKNYQLIDIEESVDTEIIFEQIPQGSTFLKFTFGFADAENTDGIYQDLNSVSFNVPGMLGGGYHYMQFDGKYKDVNDQDNNFNYHAIRAIDRSNPDNINFVDTSFEVDLGNINTTNTTKIEIKMNLAAWFKNPITWNLNELNTVLMPNFIAQKQMNLNGKSVFSLGEITN